ncbi:MAG: hypothetical protein KJO07_01695 [Deltaproteobacteria bacterium]|nr:hypothetical protein [Deltaproteobacteria bacterium]
MLGKALLALALVAASGCYTQQPGYYQQQGQQQQGQQPGQQGQPGQAPGQQGYDDSADQGYDDNGQPEDPYGQDAPPPQGQPNAAGARGQARLYDARAHRVTVNGVPLTQNQLMAFARAGLPLPSGHYWYDRVSGAFGRMGMATALFIGPNRPMRGRLSENASNGRSHVIINGRRLTFAETQYLTQLVGQPIQPGRYWLDAMGNAGFEGGPAVVNLFRVARNRPGAGGGRSKIHRGWGGTYSSDGSCYYISTGSGSVMGPGC